MIWEFGSREVFRKFYVVGCCVEVTLVDTMDPIPLGLVPSGYDVHSLPWFVDGPVRNRWFTELKNGGSFHGYVK